MNKPADLIAWPTDMPDRASVNGDLAGARNVTMQTLIGLPRGNFSQDCQPPTNPAIVALVETADVGPFRATGLRPAIASLREVLADVKVADPDLHGRLGTAGMLCCRWVRGSTSVISNHSWGTAIDLTIDGKLDARGDNRVQRGLFELRPHFNRHGWFWGAAFRTEDAMHFEASDQLIRRWADEGRFGRGGAMSELMLGDRGPRVEALQRALNERLGTGLGEDGDFGPLTHAAVVMFQRRTGLVTDGIAGRLTLGARGLGVA